MRAALHAMWAAFHVQYLMTSSAVLCNYKCGMFVLLQGHPVLGKIFQTRGNSPLGGSGHMAPKMAIEHAQTHMKLLGRLQSIGGEPGGTNDQANNPGLSLSRLLTLVEVR